MEKFVINIFTHKREDNFWKLLNYIGVDEFELRGCAGINIFKDGEEFLFSEEFYTLEETHDLVNLFITDDSHGIGYQKEMARQISLEKFKCNAFFIEDDCTVINNDVWDECMEFSEKTGLRHFNWNNYQKDPLGEVSVHGSDFYVHLDCEGSFSYFQYELLNQFDFDTVYHNALEHCDVEYQLSKKHLQPQFWTFCSPKFLDDYLESVDCDTTISNEDWYAVSRHEAFTHWEQKWGIKVNHIKPHHFERAVPSLERLKREHGTPLTKTRGRKPKADPVSIVVTIKNRSNFYYKDDSELIPHEIQRMAFDEKEISIVAKYNDGMSGIIPNKDYFKDPNGFRPFDKFLKSIDEQTNSHNGDVELVVVDWGSTDDDVEELIKCFWVDKPYKYINIKEDVFSRGYALNVGVSEATHQRIHVTDVDMRYTNTDFLKDTSTLEEDEIIFPTMLKEMTPCGFKLRFEVASLGMACFHKKMFMKAGGYPDIRQWGKEDMDFAEKCFQLTTKIKRTPWFNAIHTWHSDKHRENK